MLRKRNETKVYIFSMIECIFKGNHIFSMIQTFDQSAVPDEMESRTDTDDIILTKSLNNKMLF